MGSFLWHQKGCDGGLHAQQEAERFPYLPSPVITHLSQTPKGLWYTNTPTDKPNGPSCGQVWYSTHTQSLQSLPDMWRILFMSSKTENAEKWSSLKCTDLYISQFFISWEKLKDCVKNSFCVRKISIIGQWARSPFNSTSDDVQFWFFGM